MMFRVPKVRWNDGVLCLNISLSDKNGVSYHEHDVITQDAAKVDGRAFETSLRKIMIVLATLPLLPGTDR